MRPEMPIGERIAIYRRRRGLTQLVLAGLIGRSESWLSQVERGIRPIDRLSVLIDIAHVLKVNVTDPEDGTINCDDVTVTFTQPIGANEPLRTGAYSKTLTFTLSTTSP